MIGCRFIMILAAGAAALVPVSVRAGPNEDFVAIQREYDAWLLRENPEYATMLDVRDYDNDVSDPSIAGMDRRAEAGARLLARLDRIRSDRLNEGNRVNQAIMRRLLSEMVEANRFGQRLMLFTTYAGWHQNFAGLADSLPFNTAADYRSYLERLRQYPRINSESIAVTRIAVLGGYVLPCAVLDNSERSITGLITDDPEQSRFYAPFLRARPADTDDAQWSEMQEAARRIIRDAINPALREHQRYFVQHYLPHCSQAVGISAQPGGAEYYAFRIRQETTTDMTAQQVHDLGLAEVARIRVEMEQVATRAGFASREAFIEDLRTNPRHYAQSAEELMRHVARVTRRIDGFMPQLFTRLPRLPYTLREIPAEIAEGTTTAYYAQGSPSAGIAGTYYVNTSKLDQRPLWEIPALSMHEAVPGHHHQISLQQELDLPMWRRNFSFFTAYVEGWALYAERLGIDAGLYDTPEADMGRLSYEMWRACRLVVDTGIHAMGWSKQQAVDFMRENSALSEANIDAEVNRYISWPAQALGYKIGELRIRALRAEAEGQLGTRFNLRRFHDVVLGQGSVPLDVLTDQVRRWIATEQAAGG